MCDPSISPSLQYRKMQVSPVVSRLLGRRCKEGKGNKASSRC